MPLFTAVTAVLASVCLGQAPAQADLKYGTVIQVAPGRVQAVEKLAFPDQVLAADAAEAWRFRTVQESVGIPPAGAVNAMLLFYSIRGRDDAQLVVTADQLLMTDSGLMRADQLRPGITSLRGPDGRNAPVFGAALVAIQAGFHAISTDGSSAEGSIDGHILLANGVQVADFWVQTHQRGSGGGWQPDGAIDEFIDVRLGTDAYDEPAEQSNELADLDVSAVGPEARMLALGDTGPDFSSILGLSTPTPASARVLSRFGECLARKTAGYEAAYPGTRWPRSPVDVCHQPRAFDVTSTAKADREGHVHLTLTCPVGYRVTDASAQPKGSVGHASAIRLLPRAMHIGALHAAADSALTGDATCRLVA